MTWLARFLRLLEPLQEDIQVTDPWFGVSIDGFSKRKPVLVLREWEGWPENIDVPLGMSARTSGNLHVSIP